jgi:hypothetical protein
LPPKLFLYGSYNNFGKNKECKAVAVYMGILYVTKGGIFIVGGM